MQEFRTYIDSILKDLKTSNRKKAELKDEMLDHLEMSKLEYLQKGYTQDDAIKLSIADFGDVNKIKNTFITSNFSSNKFLYVSLTAVVVIFLLHMLLPLMGMVIAYSDFNTKDTVSYSSIFRPIINELLPLVIFVPIGFLIPLVFKKIGSYKLILGVSIIIFLTFIYIQMQSRQGIFSSFTVGRLFFGHSIINFEYSIMFGLLLHIGIKKIITLFKRHNQRIKTAN